MRAIDESKKSVNALNGVLVTDDNEMRKECRAGIIAIAQVLRVNEQTIGIQLCN